MEKGETFYLSIAAGLAYLEDVKRTSAMEPSNMNLRMSAQDLEITPELKHYAERRVHFGLARFATRIKSVQFRLADANGPKGGIDKICLLRVRTRSGEVVIRERQPNVYA